MPHPTIGQLTDYLLREADATASERIADHLSSGCESCNRLFEMIERVQRVGVADAAERPPAAAVRTVKALCGFHRQRRRPRELDMRLSFDSFLQPAAAGTRSPHTFSRHLVFYAEQLALDVRMDYERSARDLVIVGQLIDRDRGPLADVPVYLVSGEDALAHSATGTVGEFHMECRPSGELSLRLAVDDDQLIEVKLDRRRPRGSEPPAGPDGDRESLPGATVSPISYSRRGEKEDR